MFDVSCLREAFKPPMTWSGSLCCSAVGNSEGRDVLHISFCLYGSGTKALLVACVPLLFFNDWLGEEGGEGWGLCSISHTISCCWRSLPWMFLSSTSITLTSFSLKWASRFPYVSRRKQVVEQELELDSPFNSSWCCWCPAVFLLYVPPGRCGFACTLLSND